MSPTLINEKVTAPNLARLATALVFVFVFFAFLATDRWFSIVDDETAIVDAARRSPALTIERFWSGAGEHEHPPLSDLLLHFWIGVGGGAQWSLRLPSVALYLLGLLLLALAARKRAGEIAFRSLLAIGLLSPFAFHFARMTGWYSFCFFLVAAITWAYWRHLETPSALNFALFTSGALGLVYANYFGWIVLGMFVFEAWFSRQRREALRLVITSLAIIVIAYIPLWIVFGRKIAETAGHESGPLLPKILQSGFSFYTIFVSESVAPWFWAFSVPALCFIALSLITTAILLTSESRRFLVYFLMLFVTLAALDMNTKRLLFITPWLLWSLALALSNRTRPVPRLLLTISLIGVAAIGWGGTVTRRAYAAHHFTEPWAEIGDQAALAVRQGALVVSNSPSFLFDVNYSLAKLQLVPEEAPPAWVKHRYVIPTATWSADSLPSFSSAMLVKGTNRDWISATEAAEQWLRSRCIVRSEQKLVPDTGRELKARLFRGAGQDEYRVAIVNFDCPGSASASARN
jgi:hypothetical protein